MMYLIILSLFAGNACSIHDIIILTSNNQWFSLTVIADTKAAPTPYVSPPPPPPTPLKYTDSY